MAAIGCGAIQDRKSIEGLTRLLSDQSSETQHSAAFAIGIIKSASTLTITEELIKSGDENLSQAAAECLAVNPIEGFPILQSAAESDQILVRRAAVIGLAQTHQDWAVSIIEKLAVQDGQWVVRNVAGQTLELLKQHPGFIPSPLAPAHDSAWLLSFASQLGVGIPVGQPGMDILLSALQTGTTEQKIASMDYLRSIHSQEAISAIKQAARDSNHDVQQAAINTLWLYALSGVRVSA